MQWPPSKPVIVPVDLSPSSWQALDAALAIARPELVHLLHVLEPLPRTILGTHDAEFDDTHRSHEARQLVQAAITERQAQGAITASPVVAVRMGPPAAEIVDYASEVAADLIVIPSHGHSGLARMLLGSVAEKVLRHAHCPVLVLRRQGDD